MYVYIHIFFTQSSVSGHLGYFHILRISNSSAINTGIYMKVKSLSRVQLFATPWTVAYQAPPSWDSPGKSTGVGCHFPSPGDLPISVCFLWKI